MSDEQATRVGLNEALFRQVEKREGTAAALAEETDLRS